MNTYKSLFIILSVSLVASAAQAQSTFQNLNFEAADIPPGTPNLTFLSISEALPGWNAYYDSSLIGIEPATHVTYNGISIGGPVISIIDINAPMFAPLQGNYSAFLFGGVGFSATISQTGTIPTGTQSLLMNAWSFDASPIVAINGQPITMIPLQTFANYSLYGGTLPAADVGQSVTLSFTEPPPASGGPSEFELDNISFSPNAVPEPSPLVLTGIGGILFALYRRFAPKRP